MATVGVKGLTHGVNQYVDCAVLLCLCAIFSVTNIWVGLRRRLSGGEYEWSDSNLQPSYASRSSGRPTNIYTVGEVRRKF